MIIFLFLLMTVMILLPFIPAVWELRKKKDPENLRIDMDFSKDPRYFGLSFRQILRKAFQSVGSEAGFYTVVMSKPERIELITDGRRIIKEDVSHLLYCKGGLVLEPGTRCSKEIYVQGNAEIKPGCRVLSLAADGRIAAGPDIVIVRWLDAKKGIRIMEHCDLGVSVSSAGRLELGRNCSFKRLSGNPVVTAPGAACPAGPVLKNRVAAIRIPDNIRLRHGINLTGNIKVDGGFTIDTREPVNINGSIFAEGPIRIFATGVVRGNLFSQESIHLKGITIGQTGGIKSVIGKKEVLLDEDTKVYGYIMTEGRGTTA